MKRLLFSLFSIVCGTQSNSEEEEGASEPTTPLSPDSPFVGYDSDLAYPNCHEIKKMEFQYWLGESYGDLDPHDGITVKSALGEWISGGPATVNLYHGKDVIGF